MSEPHTNQHHPDQGPAVHRITEAQESHAVEQHSRVLKYTISMSVRLACFIAAFFVHGWLQWAFLAAAIVLPYIAVVIANGGADLTKREPRAEFYDGDEPRLLTSGTTTDRGTQTGTAGTKRSDGEVFTVNEDGETISEGNAAGQDPQDHEAAMSFDTAPEDFPSEAPTTIDGAFMDEPPTPAQPSPGHRHPGGAA